MGAVRKLRRQRSKQGVDTAVRVKLDFGPMSSVLLDFLGHGIDPTSLNEEQLRQVLTVASAAWNTAFVPEYCDNFRALFTEGRHPNDSQVLHLFDRLVSLRRDHFAGDPRRVVSTDIDYPNGQRRVLVTSVALEPRR